MTDDNTMTTWDYSLFWNETVLQLRNDLSDQEYAMWLQRINYVRSEENGIVVQVPSPFFRDQVKQRYLDLINRKVNELTGMNMNIIFEIGTSIPNDAPKATHNSKEKNAHPSGVISSRKKNHFQLNPDYSFENFIIGDNSAFAANAAMAIARNPGTSYNPCLIYGKVGLGKTHLIQSIGNWVLNNFDKFKIIYVTMETFINDFITSIKEKRTQAFKTLYRQADILLIDDIHFIQKKPETQEELFHTFNSMYNANKQMVFTCDRSVSEMQDMTDRLRNRFERGLNVDLQPPSFETRYAILKKKVDQKGVPIPNDVIELICNNISTNVRDLEAALIKLIAYSELVEENITIEIAHTQLKDYLTIQRQTNISIEAIQRVVADYFNISINDLKSTKRSRQYSFPRQIAMYITREITEYSTTEVGYEFGGRDHTTVMHGCQRIKDRALSDPTINENIQLLIQTLKKFHIRK